jgi:nitric oxide reductase NorD protein
MTSPPPSSAERRARWRAAHARLVDVSVTLARRFSEHTTAFVPRVDAALLEAWAEAGARLRTEAGWRGERLAVALFESSRDTLPLLAAADVAPWMALARHCAGELDEAEFLRALPGSIGGWDTADRAAWLDAALSLPPPLALVAYRELPRALDRLGDSLLPRFLAAWRIAAVDGSAPELAEVTPLLAALLAAVPEADREGAVTIVEQVARAFPAGLPALLRSLPRIYESAAAERVHAWAAHGLSLAARHRAAGVAFFAVASRTSERILADSPTAVTLEEIQGELRRLVHMLAARPAAPRPCGPFRLRPPLEESPDSPTVALPQLIDRLDTCEDNARLYRLTAALLAGRREFGTYDVLASGPGPLRAPGRPGALEDLFLLTDGFRVACRLTIAYPGVGADLRWASESLVGVETTVLDAFDAVLALALRPEADRRDVPAWLRALAALVLPSLRELERPGATAADALRVAERLAVLFPEAEPADDGVLPDLVTILLDAEAGDGPPGSAEDTMRGPAAAAPDDDPLPAELRDALTLLVDEELGDVGGGRPLDPEALRRLLEAARDTALGQGRGDVVAQAGLYVTQLAGKRLAGRATPPAAGARQQDAVGGGLRPAAGEAAVFFYDEWDHLIDDYRPAWCRVREVELPGDSGLAFDQALARHAALVPEVRRHFLRLRPERYRRIHGLEDGEVIDLNAVVDARVQRRAGQPASAKLYATRRREERDVATLFLLDLSASTDETAPDTTDRIIDIAKDSLVIMASALEEIGDLYAIYGFSGQGRDNVEVYPVKAFTERLTPAVQSRIGGLEPRGSTRMGTALRHAVTKMANVMAPSRHLVLLSDGFPQDLDYGSDRQSHVYGIRDTAVALREVQRAGVRPFCITVDLAGHDYLREMCSPEHYLVIEAVSDLPGELPKIYQRLVRAA